MKIKNDYVKIKIDKKEYTFNNLILNKYLEKIVSSQKNDGTWLIPKITYVLFKFNEKLNFNETSNVEIENFDYGIGIDIREIKKSKNKVEIFYTIDMIKDKHNFYEDKKITALGFCDDENDCLACLDTSSYTLKWSPSQTLTIFRKDTIQTDAIFESDINIPCPLHYLPETYNGYKGHLEKIGLGDKVNLRKEIALTNENTIYQDNKIIFNGILENEHVLNIQEPGFRKPSSNFYPVDIGNAYNYVYLIYNVYYNENSTGNRYYLKIPVNLIGNFNYAIKYERSGK